MVNIVSRADRASHWYSKEGEAKHFSPYADPKRAGETKPTTLADARKQGLYPSVTNILGVLDKPALGAWKIEQAILSTMTLPKYDDETDESFAKRAVNDSQEQVSEAAKVGTAIHKILEHYLETQEIKKVMKIGFKDPNELVAPTLKWIDENVEKVMWSEMTLVGDGYAGKADALLALKKEQSIVLYDFKSKKLGKYKFNPYVEWGLQLAAYQKCVKTNAEGFYPEIRSLVINSEEPTPPIEFDWTQWQEYLYENFLKCRDLWVMQKNYDPTQPDRKIQLFEQLT